MQANETRTHALVIFARHRARLVARITTMFAQRQVEVVSLLNAGSREHIAPIYLSVRLPSDRSLEMELKRLNRCIDVVEIVTVGACQEDRRRASAAGEVA